MYISNWVNNVDDSLHYLRDEVEPYSLPVILHTPADDVLTHEQVLEATVAAFINFFDSEMVSADLVWVDSLKTWMQGRIRKVVRRAKTSAFVKVKEELTHFYFNHNGVEILILPPHPVSQPPLLVKRLQVSGLDLPSKGFSSLEEVNSGLLLAVNPDLSMSTGKMLAQVGHAVQLSVLYSTVDNLVRWHDNGFPFQFVDWPDERLQAKNIIEVYDAGFTEVEAGSLTVKAVLT